MATIDILDASFEYGFEFLGNGPRLVITPLTDRIYVTATQVSVGILGDVHHPTIPRKYDTALDPFRAVPTLFGTTTWNILWDYFFSSKRVGAGQGTTHLRAASFCFSGDNQSDIYGAPKHLLLAIEKRVTSRGFGSICAY